MPIISRFLGIIITMYWEDHHPPHFHAKYGDFEITVEIETGIVSGKFPKRALGHILEWHSLHKLELMQDWELCSKREQPNQISGLE